MTPENHTRFSAGNHTHARLRSLNISISMHTACRTLVAWFCKHFAILSRRAVAFPERRFEQKPLASLTPLPACSSSRCLKSSWRSVSQPRRAVTKMIRIASSVAPWQCTHPIALLQTGCCLQFARRALRNSNKDAFLAPIQKVITTTRNPEFIERAKRYKNAHNWSGIKYRKTPRCR